MLLSHITADPKRFQFRDKPYSEKTVAGIVREGLDPAKFDPLPILSIGKGRYCVAGDGHSRFEALRRLAAAGTLPASWRKGKDWEIPTRTVDAAQAQLLAWTANLSRDNFSPCEEAKVYQNMIDTGRSVDAIAALVQRSESYVKKTLALNCLCFDIKAAVGLSPDAGGIDKHIAQALAEKFQQYEIHPAQQQELWHRVLKHANLTAPFVRALVDKIGKGLQDHSDTENFLFEIPASVAHAVKDMKDKADQLRRAQRGLAWLMQCKDSGVIDRFPTLRALLDLRGESMLEELQSQTAEDASLISQLVIAA